MPAFVTEPFRFPTHSKFFHFGIWIPRFLRRRSRGRRPPNRATIKIRHAQKLVVQATRDMPHLELERGKTIRVSWYLVTSEPIGTDATTGEACSVLVVTARIDLTGTHLVTVYPAPRVMPWHSNTDVKAEWAHRIEAMKTSRPGEVEEAQKLFEILSAFYGV